jgi:transposase
MNDQMFISAPSLRDQIAVALPVIRSTENKFSYEEIAHIFTVSKTSTYKQVKKAEKLTRPIGRPPILSNEATEFMIKIINEGFEARQPVHYDYILDILQYKFNISILPDTLRNICQTNPNIKTVRGIPIEKEKINVDRNIIDTWYDELAAVSEDIPASFIFNVDESGCNDYVDSHEIRVLVPSWFEGTSIRIPVDRNVKRATLVGCISGDGQSLNPLIILPRKTIEDEISLFGFTQETSVFVYQQNAFMSTSLFEKWAQEIFFPNVENKRSKTSY